MKNHVLAAIGALSVVGASASAQVVTIGPFALAGTQEVPANASPAIGSGTLNLNITTGDFTLDYSFSGLTGTVTVAHFHRALPGVNGGVVYWLAASGAPNSLPTTLMSPSLPTGVTSHGPASGVGVFSPTLIGDALAGRLYMNVHTTAFGGGEIRGQVVPTPGALALIGLGGLVATRRRRN